MRYRTELMEKILTNEKAQEMIDYVSPIYGNSYVGLWLFQAAGISVSSFYDLCVKLKTEGNPITSELLLDYHEKRYGLPVNRLLSVAQRQERIRNKKLSRGSCNPARLAAAVSVAIGGAKVEIVENWKKNTFLVIIREAVTDLTPVKEVLDKRKPAHLIYEIIVEIQTKAETEVKVATALTHAEQYKVEVMQ